LDISTSGNRADITRIQNERQKLAASNPEGDDSGHRKAEQQWAETTERLKDNNHRLQWYKNWKLHEKFEAKEAQMNTYLDETKRI
jgi:hypothetical protein